MSDSMSSFRTRAAHTLLVAGSALLVSLPSNALAQAQTACGPEIKEAVAAALASVEFAPDEKVADMEKTVYEKFKYCIQQDAALVPSTFIAAARECGATVSNLGSIFFEEMPCAGYDPQRRQFAAPVKIKQNFGFGAAALPGSREHVLHCVAAGPGAPYLPVGFDSVHLANSTASPTWQFAVIVNANMNLQLIQPMLGQTRLARSILSWNLRPTGCDYTPIWGNALNYRIRIDQ